MRSRPGSHPGRLSEHTLTIRSTACGVVVWIKDHPDADHDPVTLAHHTSRVRQFEKLRSIELSYQQPVAEVIDVIFGLERPLDHAQLLLRRARERSMSELNEQPIAQTKPAGDCANTRRRLDVSEQTK